MMAQKDETASRLVSIPSFGPITASATMPTIQDTTSFAGPPEFAAFLGQTPKQNSSGGANDPDEDQPIRLCPCKPAQLPGR